jgi:membrane protease YdiL (CAAX protease family)
MHDHDEHTQRIRWDVVAVIGLVSLIGVLGFKFLWMVDGYRSVVRSWPIDMQYVIHPILRMLLVVVGVMIVFRMSQSDNKPTMGLGVGWARALKGIAIGFGCTLPMLLLGLWSDSFTASRYGILYGSISPGLTEEIFYRAFMFGLLVQVARCPMWPTAILTGAVFGLAHVDITPDEGQTIIGQLGFWIAMIGVGGMMYAWIYQLSRWNLWIVIALHAGMNLWWDMFVMNATPLGGWGATAVRVLSVGLVVLIVMRLRGMRAPQRSTIERE